MITDGCKIRERRTKYAINLCIPGIGIIAIVKITLVEDHVRALIENEGQHRL